MPASNLDRSLKLLVTAKRIVRVDHPLSGQALRAPRYSIADPYLRFWLRFVEPALGEIERRRGPVVVDRILRDWPTYRGRAVEPILRDLLERWLPDERLPDAAFVGGFWTRRNDPEVDVIGADRPSAPARVAFAGSIKWRERAPFDGSDVGNLAAKATLVPGVTVATPLVAISRSGIDPSARGLAAGFGPDDLLAPA